MYEQTALLDEDQLQDVTLGDRELIRDILCALVDDTQRQLPLLAAAIAEQDSERCSQLAHYCKGACANVGACSASTLLGRIEVSARQQNFPECARSFTELLNSIEQLRQKVAEMSTSQQ